MGSSIEEPVRGTHHRLAALSDNSLSADMRNPWCLYILATRAIDAKGLHPRSEATSTRRQGELRPRDNPTAFALCAPPW